ncbi:MULTISPECIES: hypothetical protein [unclassified Acinetobacter]|uniref:hypothetical protein n=1 Tax=unclassified Acinetobacter TaxID=196816 RepID=UPI000449286E|nr:MULTISPECIES: hypothetical protein [unclassified Acinetobacter]EZQ00916.1 hypothetical protein CL42_16560 [Acinetobacter sp. Ver3]SEL55351.1 hypothetical protein SAMN05216500_103126 [Acinetobacter sp. DSM 11652]
MKNFSVNDLDLLIEKYRKADKEVKKILIGYKLFGELMNDSKFHEEVINSALSTTKRKYKKIKIRITTDEYQLDFE